VTLPEYNNVEAFLKYTDISRKRMNTVAAKKYLREGKEEIMEVIKVDTRSCSIDVTKKTVKKE
jgi:translation initiation factor 2 alpha subunit (eIF-2alpha)